MSLVKSLMRLAPVLAVTLAVGMAAAGRPSGHVDFSNVPFRFSRPSTAQTEIPVSGATVNNQYRVPTYGEGIAKAVRRLKGTDPLVMSNEDFAANGASLTKTSSAAAPLDGKAQVKLDGDAILVRFAGHEERILLKQPPANATPEDHGKFLESAASRLLELMHESHERPERVEWSTTQSCYVIVTGGANVVVPKPDMQTTIDVERPGRLVDVEERLSDEPEIAAPAPRPSGRPRDFAQRRAQPAVN